MRTALFIIIIFLASIVDRLETMPDLAIYSFAFCAVWNLAGDYYKSISKPK